MIKSAGSALGEDIGNLIEVKVRAIAQDESQQHGFEAAPCTLRNMLGSQHRIDIVIRDQNDHPIILIEPKYLRYTKHNWDKGSRLIAGHYNLKKTHRTIAKSIAVLAGNWTSTSIAFLQNFGVEVHRVAFDTIAEVLSQYGVPFDWKEKDKRTPPKALRLFRKLSKGKKQDIADMVVQHIEEALRASIRATLTLDPSAPRSIQEVEILIKTQHGEFYLSSFENVTTAMQYLLRLQRDVPDLKAILGEDNVTA